jgi:tetratricopeptide (TPR) repeat protein
MTFQATRLIRLAIVAAGAGALATHTAYVGVAYGGVDTAHPADFAVSGEDHTNFGRIDIAADAKARYRVEHDGDRVLIRFEFGTHLTAPGKLPRNVLAAKADGAILELTLVHGASVHPMRAGGHVYFDVIDVPGSEKRGPEKQGPEKPAAEKAAQDRLVLDKPASAEAATHEPAVLAVSTAPVAPVKRETAQDSAVIPMPKPGAPLPPAPPLPSGFAGSPELGGRIVAIAAPKAEPPAPPPAAAPPAPAAASPPPAPVQNADIDDDNALPPMPTDERAPAIGRDVLPGADPQQARMARRVRLRPDEPGTAIDLPFAASVAAAAFQGATASYIVFDQRQPVSLTLLKDDPVFSNVVTRLLPNGTLFQVKLPPNQYLGLTHVSWGWRVTALPAPPRPQGIEGKLNNGQLTLPVELHGAVLTMADPDTGSTLMIGTTRRPNLAVALPHRTAEFIERQTVQGIVVEPLADSIQLQPIAQGFSLSNRTGRLAMSPVTPAMQATVEAQRLSRSLDLPELRTETLRSRLEREFMEAGAIPPLSRGALHKEAAETMLALGYSAEAEGLLQTLAEQDPQLAAAKTTEVLTGVSAILAGRPNEAEALDDPKLNGNDEIDFWRAVRQAMGDEGSPAAAAVFASTAPLLMLYPKPITERVLPLVVETMLLGGAIPPAVRMLDTRPNDPKLAYARALRKQVDGDTDGALAMLDQLANNRDQFDSFRASVHAIELRLSARRIDSAQAADALEKLLIAWRGDDRELALRERIADLRAQIGGWRGALTILRDAERDFPERQAAIRARLETMFGKMIGSDDNRKIPPLDFVAMVDENTDLMPRFEDDPAVQQALVDRLDALDLPDRAIPLERKLLQGARSELAKARYGASLAALQAREGQDKDALATLDATESDQAPPDLAESRILTRATAIAHTGNRDSAITLLKELATAGASAKRAELLEEAKDWANAEAAWQDSLTASVPPASGPVSMPIAHTLVRLATAASRNKDDATLATLRQTWLNRLPAGEEADAFNLLTSPPVQTTADLARSAAEVNLAASVAAGDKKATQ